MDVVRWVWDKQPDFYQIVQNPNRERQGPRRHVSCRGVWAGVDKLAG